MSGSLNSLHLEQVQDFVNTYDRLYANLAALEEAVQELLIQQKAVVEELESTRKAEHDFFSKVSDETGVDKKMLKSEAANWVSVKRSETFFQP